MNIEQIVKQMTTEEKALILTGATPRQTNGVERLGIAPKVLVDGPHGVRKTVEDNCTMFPAVVSMGATWDKELIFEMGAALGEDCIEQGVDMILAPGINIKRVPQCGRNFEYVSEDPVVAGEIGAAYINGVQSVGVATSLKHFALNNQERHRLQTSVEVDMRVMHELYFKPFEIAIKKSNPVSVMCSYNKVHSIWASENEYLLTKVLKEKWGFDGFVVSDWGAVRDICKSVMAGLDLQMPRNWEIIAQIKEGLEKGTLTEKALNSAVARVLKFITAEKATHKTPYDRDRQHEIARRVATDGIVVVKNCNNTLPITAKKYKKVAVIGEYAVNPLNGQGSAEVYPQPEYKETPLEELKKILGDEVEISYHEFFIRKAQMNEHMIWGKTGEWIKVAQENDAVIVFTGSMESEDTEQYDRNSLNYYTNFDFVINAIARTNPNTVVVSQSGGVMLPGDWRATAGAIVEMWIAGEGGGGAIADVLTGKVNPSGKLTETFPKKPREGVEYPGDGLKVRYNEGFDVGYRYYDKHPDEILYPFGFGLSYTTFAYENCKAELAGDNVRISLDVKNTGDCDGAEVVQFYVSKENSIVSRPIKELKGFEKVFVKAGETKHIESLIPVSDLAYYNVMLGEDIVEPGVYTFMVAASSQDIRYSEEVNVEGNAPFTINSHAYASLA